MDLYISDEELMKLDSDEIKTIKHYGFFDKEKKQWHYAFDDIRFCNHSSQGNIVLKDGSLNAINAIKKGEEITQNYSEFEKLREDIQ